MHTRQINIDELRNEDGQTGFKELVKAVRQKYGKPALKKAETGKDELKKILINLRYQRAKTYPCIFGSRMTNISDCSWKARMS